MLAKIVIELSKIDESVTKHYGRKEGDKIFTFILNSLQLQLKTKAILFELDNLIELYSNHLFSITEEFYKTKYKKSAERKDKEILDIANKINGNPKHKISDEITLLFYVGLYHKIENYENEILEFYNLLNESNYKTLKSIGIDIPNKKNLFADRDRIRIICNSIKHNNYYPKKELLKYYSYLSIDKKISLEDLNPKEDLELVKNYIKYFNFLIAIKNALSKLEILKGANGSFPNELFELTENFEELLKDEEYKDEKYLNTYLKK